MFTRRSSFLAMAVLSAISATVHAQPDEAAVRKLVEQLRSNDFKAREKAALELSKLPTVPDVLRDATKNGDAEVRSRAQKAVEIITARIEEKAFQAMVADLNKVEFDRFIRRMITDEKFAGDKQWDIVQTLVKAVTKRANDLSGQKYPVPDFDMKAMPFADLAMQPIHLGRRRVLLNQYAGRFTSIDGAVVLCSGTMPRVTGISNSIILVDGDMVGATSLQNSLLIVSGKLGRFTGVHGSIILVAGEFGVKEEFGNNKELRGATGCDSSFLQVKNDKVRFTSSTDCVLVKTQTLANRSNNRVLDIKDGPLRLLKFSVTKTLTDDQLVWGKESGGLAVAIAPTDRPECYLIRWKNVGKETLELQAARHNFDNLARGDDLLNHVFVKGDDGKPLPARPIQFLKAGAPRRLPTVILESGKSHEETIDLAAYVVRPNIAGRYKLSIELDINAPLTPSRPGARFWTGKVQSNELDITYAK